MLFQVSFSQVLPRSYYSFRKGDALDAVYDFQELSSGELLVGGYQTLSIFRREGTIKSLSSSLGIDFGIIYQIEYLGNQFYLSTEKEGIIQCDSAFNVTGRYSFGNSVKDKAVSKSFAVDSLYGVYAFIEDENTVAYFQADSIIPSKLNVKGEFIGFHKLGGVVLVKTDQGVYSLIEGKWQNYSTPKFLLEATSFKHLKNDHSEIYVTNQGVYCLENNKVVRELELSQVDEVLDADFGEDERSLWVLTSGEKKRVYYIDNTGIYDKTALLGIKGERLTSIVYLEDSKSLWLGAMDPVVYQYSLNSHFLQTTVTSDVWEVKQSDPQSNMIQYDSLGVLRWRKFNLQDYSFCIVDGLKNTKPEKVINERLTIAVNSRNQLKHHLNGKESVLIDAPVVHKFFKLSDTTFAVMVDRQMVFVYEHTKDTVRLVEQVNPHPLNNYEGIFDVAYFNGNWVWSTSKGIFLQDNESVKARKFNRLPLKILEPKEEHFTGINFTSPSHLFCQSKTGGYILKIPERLHGFEPKLQKISLNGMGGDIELKEMPYAPVDVQFQFGNEVLVRENHFQIFGTLSTKDTVIQFEQYTNTLNFKGLTEGDYDLDLTVRSILNPSSPLKIKRSFTMHIPLIDKVWFRILAISLSLGILLFGIYLHYNAKLRKKEFQRQLAVSEIESLKAQMNPHFLFNVLNSIQLYIVKNDTRKASKYLNKYSKLTRMILENSHLGKIDLEEEIQMLTMYLELEQVRFPGRFRFEISRDENLDEMSVVIPSMIIQPYVENAIIHGVSKLSDGSGLIEVAFRLKGDVMEVRIKDNGVGLNSKPTEPSGDKKSLAKSITERRLALLSSITHSKYSVAYAKVDKGTEVILKFQLDED